MLRNNSSYYEIMCVFNPFLFFVEPRQTLRFNRPFFSICTSLLTRKKERRVSSFFPRNSPMGKNSPRRLPYLIQYTAVYCYTPPSAAWPTEYSIYCVGILDNILVRWIVSTLLEVPDTYSGYYLSLYQQPLSSYCWFYNLPDTYTGRLAEEGGWIIS